MSRNSMPFLVVNYGAEMVFILEQRLHAQNVKPEKAGKVLADVTKSMFAPQFVQELLRTQEIYTVAATREIFDHLAQSSIMRLSENSMDKLYDLMTMGCKFQVISCRHPMELVELTLNHVEAVMAAVTGSPSEAHLQNTLDQVLKLSQSMSCGLIADVRHVLLNFYIDKRVKVSLFLNDGLQSTDGTFQLPRGGEVVTTPPVQQIGTIHYYESGQCVAEENFNHPDIAIVKPASRTLNAFDPSQRTTPLGKNLYISGAKKNDEPTAAAMASKVAAAKPESSTPPKVVTTASPLAKKNTSFRQRSSLNSSDRGASRGTGLNALSAMIATQAPKEAVKINLFDDPAEDGGPVASSGAAVIEIGRVSRDDVAKANAELMGIYTGLDATSAPTAGAGSADVGQDLLDLMDEP